MAVHLLAFVNLIIQRIVFLTKLLGYETTNLVSLLNSLPELPNGARLPKHVRRKPRIFLLLKRPSVGPIVFQLAVQISTLSCKSRGV